VVRPDFSDYVVHFTKESAPFGLAAKRKTIDGLDEIAAMSAYQRLVAILEDRRIRATNMPHTHDPCVCFTECVWGSLLDHAQRYSCYGLGFDKRLLFRSGGGPAFYMRQDLFAAIRKLPRASIKQLWPFITPFVPQYAPTDHLDEYWPNKGYLDYSYEREWRVPQDFAFALSDVSFVVVNSYTDEAKMPREIKNAIGRENVILMENYRKVNELWPWHHY